MQGWRIGMEDAHICLNSLSGEGYWGGLGLFGVLDGHGGEQVAKFSSIHLPQELCKFSLGKESWEEDLRSALIGSFHRMDELLRDRTATGPELQALTNAVPPEAAVRAQQHTGPVDVDMVGCTACVCCITEDQLVVANAGDSRAVLCRGGVAVALSEDHKPNQAREKARIEAAGGYVENSTPGQYRVNGNLNLSRALGDLEYKKDPKLKPEEQIIAATPDVTFFDRTADDEFVVICCDGVWDVKTNQEVVDFVRKGLESATCPSDSSRILEDLLDSCISPDLRATRGLGGDNMTAVLVRLPGPHNALPAAPKSEEALHLARVRVKEAETALCGTLELHFALPGGSRLGELSLRLSEAALKLEVGCLSGKEGLLLRSVSLKEHLPSGAELLLPPGASAPGTFLKRPQLLRVRLPWKKLGGD